MTGFKAAITFTVLLVSVCFNTAWAQASAEAIKLAESIDTRYAGDANAYNRDKTGFLAAPPMLKYIRDDRRELVEVMLDRGFDLNANASPRHYSPLSQAIAYKQIDLAGFLIEQGATMAFAEQDTIDKSHPSPLFNAVTEDDPEMVQFVLGHGATLWNAGNLARDCCKRDEAGLARAREAASRGQYNKPAALQALAGAEDRLREKKAAEAARLAAEQQQQEEERLRAEVDNRLASLQQDLQGRGSVIESRDAVLPESIRRDKYLVAFSNAMKQENYADAALYAGLLERLDMELEDSLYYFWAEALLNLELPAEALDKLGTYLNRIGNSGQYYTQALNLMLKVEESLN